MAKISGGKCAPYGMAKKKKSVWRISRQAVTIKRRNSANAVRWRGAQRAATVVGFDARASCALNIVMAAA